MGDGMRNFEAMDTDALYALWDGYKRTDWGGYDPLHQCVIYSKAPIRLTPLEIIKLLDEVFLRLLKKEGYEVKE